ncbi:MAG: hypothetical protein L6Q59_00610 [Ignavibacteriaceae bacterium]|nr:hypothetical protein [Ignavibacteriaceae bacterium]
MKKVLILSLLLFTGSLTFADSTYVYASYFYTYGDFSNKGTSNDHGAYISTVLGYTNILSGAFNKINREDKDWLYEQNSFFAGYTKVLFPLYLKANFAHITGTFDYKPYEYQYKDKTNLFNIGAAYYVPWFYLSAGATYLNVDGFKPVDVYSGVLRADYVPSWYFSLTLAPQYTKVSDGRSMFGLNVKLNWMINNNLIFRGSAFTGERAYHFDSDLFTIYNQDETQKLLLSGTIEHRLFNSVALQLSYQYNDFTNYQVNYYIAGIKTNFTF